MNETIRQLVAAVRENPDESSIYGGLADAMDEADVPGAAVVRAAGEHARKGDGPHGWAGVPDSALTRRLLREHYAPEGPGVLRRVNAPSPFAAEHGFTLPDRLHHANVAGRSFFADASTVGKPDAPVKLARDSDKTVLPDIAGFIHAIKHGTHESLHYLALADYMADRGMLGHGVVRQVGEQVRDRPPGRRWLYHPDRAQFRRLMLEHYDAKFLSRVPPVTLLRRSYPATGRPGAPPPDTPPLMVAHYDFGRPLVAAVHPGNVDAITADMPEAETEQVREAVRNAYRDAPHALARTGPRPLSQEERKLKDALAKPGTPRGLPPAPKLPRPLEDQREYHRRFGAALGLSPFDARPVSIANDPVERGREVGRQYDRMRHDPNGPETKAAYDQFKKEILLQYKFMTDRGLKVEPWKGEGQPYESSPHMIASVLKHHHLFYYPTGPGQIPEDHPLAEAVPGTPGTSYNDLFRAVHDYFGHAVHANSFGPRGEIKAYLYHRRMFSPLARKAMATETMGQNSWVNFGPHEPWKLPLKDRPFAPQKAGVLKLARIQAQGLGSATRAEGSDNHAKRLELARRVFEESGLEARVLSVLAHDNAGSKPGVFAAASHVGNPQHALYAAAWLGLMTQAPRMTVFTPGEGEDTMHVFDSPHPPAHVADYLRKARAGPFVTEARGGGTRATIVSPLDSLDADTLARGLHASHTAARGRADRIGSSAGADGGTKSAAAGRAAYRQVIADAERAAG